MEYVSIKRIAEQMHVEESTVKWHLKNMCAKAGCASKADLAIRAANARIVLPKLRNHSEA